MAGYYLDPKAAFRGDQGASETLGKLSRAQWNDWKQRYAPIVDDVADLAGDAGYGDRQAGLVRSAVGSAYDRSARTLAMQNDGLGINQTQRQQQSQNRQQALARSASMVSSGNEARTSAIDLQSQLLAGGYGLQQTGGQ